MLQMLLLVTFALHGNAAASSASQAPATTVAPGPRDAGLNTAGTETPEISRILLLTAPTLRPEALRAALDAWDRVIAAGHEPRPILTVIDYSLPSTARRLWVFDMMERRLIYHELVAHGRGSGEDFALAFSNVEGSLMTSLGAFLTGETYVGRNGYSMRLHGLEPGVNDLAEARYIVMHGAPYVTEEFARRVGRLGRSHGCPALRPEIARPLIDTIKDRSLLYAWHPGSEPAAAAATPR